MNVTENIKVFFDESGKRKNKPNLMGGLSIPDTLYSLPSIDIYSQKLRNGEIKLHWENVTANPEKTDTRANIMTVLKDIAQYHQLIKINVINYDYSTLANRANFGRDLIEQMIYTKFPERIIYGLLRGYGRNTNITTDIYIEHATEYEKLKLDEVIKEQLNIQSLYRGEQFAVNTSELVPKGREIGVELTDLLLGIIRTILENKGNNTKGNRIRNEVIVELFKNNDFYSLMSNIKYFEWVNTRELTEVSFSDYLQLYLAKHFNAWKEM